MRAVPSAVMVVCVGMEFGLIAEVAGLHIESNVVGHLGPPVVPCDKF